MNETYCVVYRTGGRERFQWHRTLPVDSHSDATETRDTVVKQGYHAFIENYRLSVCAGLPETYEYVQPFA